MKKNVTDILDIHTHKLEADSLGKSIVNYPLLADSPLYMPLAKNAEVAVSRGLLLEEYLGFLNEGEGLVDALSNNVFSARKGYYYSAGIHPWELAERNADQQLAFLQKQLKTVLSKGKCPGFISFHEFTRPITGLFASSSEIPIAYSNALR